MSCSESIDRVTVVSCVWCGKSMSKAESDSYGRCEFDSHYPFTSEGEENSILDKFLIANWLVLNGLGLP